MRPDLSPLLIEAGPTAVHDCCDTELVGSCVKMRNAAVNWSATGSPRPEPATELVSVSFQLTRVPVRLDELLWICSVQAPAEPWFLKVLRGSCGLNGPAPMPMIGWVLASWIGVRALSSKVVLVKFACGLVPVVPTPENNWTCVPSGAIRTAVRSGSFWCWIESWSVTPSTRKLSGTVMMELTVWLAGSVRLLLAAGEG